MGFRPLFHYVMVGAASIVYVNARRLKRQTRLLITP